MKYNVTDRIVMMTAVLLQAFLVSCTQVDYAGMVDSFDDLESFSKSTVSKVAFNVAFPEDVSVDDIPQSMTVVLNRTRTEICRYVFNLDSEGNVIPETSDSLLVSDGYYLVSSVAAVSKDDFYISKLENFKVDDSLMMGDLYVTIPELSTMEIVDNGYIDFNTRYPFIRDVEPLYVVKPDQITGESIFSYRRPVEQLDEDHIINLLYEPLTHKLTFGLELGLGEGVQVTQVICTISGVPSKVQLLNGYISDRNTSKVPFKMTNTEGGKFSGQVDVFGLFSNPTDTTTIVGPGILNVIVHVCTEYNGRTIKRVLYKNYNLKTDIDAAELMVPTADGSAYFFNENPKTTSFSLGKIFTVTKDNIIVGAGQGCEVWEGSEDDEDPILNPGLHPEL